MLFISSRQKRASDILGRRPPCHGVTHKSQLEKKRLKMKQWDLREAVLAAVILASGMWMIIAGLTKLWGE